MYSKILSFIFVSLIILCSPCAAAFDNFEFVDANGKTGYYVDSKSAYFGPENQVEAIIAVKKAGQNRMFIYRMKFDRAQRTYQILSSQVIKYDTKEILEQQNKVEPPQTYRLQSPMNEIVDYLFAQKR